MRALYTPVKCANRNTIANPNNNQTLTSLTLTLSLTLNPNPTNPKLQAHIPAAAGRILPFAVSFRYISHVTVMFTNNRPQFWLYIFGKIFRIKISGKNLVN